MVASAKWAGSLPTSPWRAAAAVGLLLAMVTLRVQRARDNARGALLHPRHVREIAQVLRDAPNVRVAGHEASALTTDASVRVARTSLGLCLSFGSVQRGETPLTHVTFSLVGAPLPDHAAYALGRLILCLQSASGPTELLHRRGVYHLLFQ
jgi:hypothetical protein